MDIFGGLFDFDGDGKTSFDEELLGYKILDDIADGQRDEDEYGDED